MPATWSGILSTGRSEALHHHPGLPLPVAVRIHPARAAAEAPARRDARPAAADLPAAQQPAGGARLGGRPARLGRGAARRRPTGACRWRRARSIPVEGRDTRLEWLEGASAPGLPTRTACWPAAVRARPSPAGSKPGCGPVPATCCPPTRRTPHARPESSSGGSASATPAPAGAAARPRAASATIGGWSWRRRRSAAGWWRMKSRTGVHMNHGPAFKALEAELFDGDAAAARLLLRRIGPGLKRIGRGRLSAAAAAAGAARAAAAGW